MNHTKEPWRQEYGSIIGGGDDEIDSIIITRVPNWQDDVGSANARRIVACVNALEGIPTEILEMAGTGLMSEAAVEVGKLTKERDELLAALKEVIYCSEHFGRAYAGRDARDNAKSLIKRIDHA